MIENFTTFLTLFWRNTRIIFLTQRHGGHKVLHKDLCLLERYKDLIDKKLRFIINYSLVTNRKCKPVNETRRIFADFLTINAEKSVKSA